MNNTSPLIPQGATPPRAKFSLYYKILMVLSVHVVVIGGMLLQGCKDTSTQSTVKTDGASSATTDTNPMTNTTAAATADVTGTTAQSLSNSYVATTPAAAPNIQPMAAATATLGASAMPKVAATDLSSPPASSEAKEYVIGKGDTLGAIARKNGVSLKALMEANPGVDAKKLQVGHKVQIPGASTALAAATPEAAPADGDVYVVKAGDSLFKIAKIHGTTYKRIMAMNNLTTGAIRPGQKLKMPSAKAASSEPAAAPASASVTMPPAAAPMRVSSAMTTTSSPVAAN
jgi:LysM repeat protein